MKATGMVIAVILILSAGIGRAQEGSYTPVPRESTGSMKETCQFGIKRGFANLLTGWIEIPRCLSYEVTARPISSPLLGPLTGASFTAIRAVLGAIDILSGGLNGYNKYSDFIPDYPWESPWVAPETEFD
jgi:hypothetical protein